jgi:hypothetical protein
VNFHAHDVIAHSAQGILYYSPDPSSERLVPFYRMVGIDLDMHADLLPDCLIKNISYAQLSTASA